MKNILALGLTLAVLLVTGCRSVMPERAIDYNRGRIPVELPRNMRTSEKDSRLDRDNAVIVSISPDNQCFVGKEQTATPKETLANKLKPLLEKQTDPESMVFVAVGVTNPYGVLVELFHSLRKAGVTRVGLLVTASGMNFPSRVSAELSVPFDPNAELRPNPLILDASVTTDLKVKLNSDEMGAVNDTGPLSEKLQSIFRERLEQRAFKPGFEARSDLPLDERVEKTVTFSAPESIHCGDVIKVIDAIRGAGAFPVVLELDDRRVILRRDTQ